MSETNMGDWANVPEGKATIRRVQEPRVRVTRVLEYEGNRTWVDNCLNSRYVKEEYRCELGVIREGIVGRSMAMVEPEVPYAGENGAYKRLMQVFQDSNYRVTVHAGAGTSMSAGVSADVVLDIVKRAGFRLVRG